MKEKIKKSAGIYMKKIDKQKGYTYFEVADLLFSYFLVPLNKVDLKEGSAIL